MANKWAYHNNNKLQYKYKKLKISNASKFLIATIKAENTTKTDESTHRGFVRVCGSEARIAESHTYGKDEQIEIEWSSEYFMSTQAFCAQEGRKLWTNSQYGGFDLVEWRFC